MSPKENHGNDSGEHAQTAAVEKLFDAIEASTKAWNLGMAESTKWWRRILVVLVATAALIAGIGVFNGIQASQSQDRQEESARKLEAMRLQIGTVQQTADATQTAVAVIEDRPTLDLEIVDAPASAASGEAQPTAVVVIKKPRPSASQQPSVSFSIPIPLPSAPSAPAPEPKR